MTRPTPTNAEHLTTYTTIDTNEEVTFPAPHPREDAQGYSLDGYDWMDATRERGWLTLSGWGKDGWDAGAWPYLIITISRGKDDKGFFWGVTTYCEGDLDTKFYRDQMVQWQAITKWCHWNWEHGQSDGPKDLPAFEALDMEVFGRPYGDEYDGKVSA